MLSFKRMRQQSRPIHCKHLSLIESKTARVTLRKSRPLSACIYHTFREKYTVGTAKGYNDAIKRN